MRNYITIALVAVTIASVTYASLMYAQLKRANESINTLTEQVGVLGSALNEVSRVKTYSISLAPNVSTKTTAAFGKVSSLTLQYYFSMDGASIEVIPDSVVTLKK